MYTMELQLSASDADKMAELTSRSIGKQLAIVVNNEVIAAPFVSAPILNGLANVELSSSSFLVVTRSLKANLTK
jgi:preprotein translocase subunit SecD